MGDPQSLFTDFSAQDFPFWVAIIHQNTNRILWKCHVDGPGAIKVPGLGPEDPKKTIVVHASDHGTICYANGDARALGPLTSRRLISYFAIVDHVPQHMRAFALHITLIGGETEIPTFDLWLRSIADSPPSSSSES